MGRSILAIVAGFLMIAFLSIGADAILKATNPGAFNADGGMTHTGWLLVTMVYVGVFAVAGCYVTARLAQRRPMLHALILGALGLAFSLLGTIAMWDTVPVWYNIASLVLVMPYAWLGGRLREIELQRKGASVY